VAEFHLPIPLTDGDVIRLTIGDMVYFSGEAWTGRSRLHGHVFDEGYALPFSTHRRNVLIHVGPVVVREGSRWDMTAFTLTSSIQMEKWGPRAVREWGLKAILGKTTMGEATRQAMKECHCIHACPVGITPALFLEQIEVRDVLWHDELGSMEAAWILSLKEFGPFLVDIDCEGRSYFDHLDHLIEENRKKAYRRLGIPEDFEYSKLY
jgi:L(+)-tartrate dehydratase beta subunit